MRHVVAAALAFSALLGSRPHAASGTQVLELRSTEPVILRLDGVRLSEALRRLGQMRGVEITVAPGVQDARVQSWSFNVPFEDVFASIVTGECLTYSITGPHSIRVEKPTVGGRRQANSATVSYWPNCSDDYVTPAAPKVRLRVPRAVVNGGRSI
jgi:hypothetical protein